MAKDNGHPKKFREQVRVYSASKVVASQNDHGRGNNGNGNKGRWVFRETGACTFIDLFCGIGGFRIAGEAHGWNCLFSSDIDEECQRAYEANFGEKPLGDIHEIDAKQVPVHDILLAGFPCQPFSIIGDRKTHRDLPCKRFLNLQ